jgi:hypothetical protein
MKTAEQWLADASWCTRISPNTGNFTAYGIEAIQADAACAALRDQFAAAALTGLLACVSEAQAQAVMDKQASKARMNAAAYLTDLAYDYADAMMARRAQPTADAPAPAQTAP